MAEFTDVMGVDGLTNLCLGAFFPTSIILSAIVGSIFLSKIRKTSVLYVWLLFGTIASLFPIAPIGSSFVGAIIITVVLGASLGLGMPSLLSYFTESIPIENRGRIGGIAFFMVTVSAPLVIITVSMLNLASSVVLFAAWRSWSIPTLFVSSKKSNTIHFERTTSLISVFYNKTFILYFLAWLMFSMVDGFEALMLSPYIGGFGFVMNIIEPIVVGFSALIAGVLADWTGRKRVMIFGFISLGIAYAILGIASQLWISWFFYFIVDGLAIGLLWTMFTIVIWGELARFGNEKYYAIGESPYFLTDIISLLFAPFVALIPETSAFSLAAFFLFIAVIPLFYAQETLPTKKIQQRQLKIYTEEAVKLKQKVEQNQK